MNVSQDVIQELDRAEINDHQVRLSSAIARPLYVKINKVLIAAGGRWNRKAGAHVFDGDPTEVLEQAMLTGTIRQTKQELGIFYTPAKLAERAAKVLEIEPGMSVLEPSAGLGALATAAGALGGKVCCFDILQLHADALKWAGFSVIRADFLEQQPGPLFDRILMNPPFAQQADARHFIRAMSFLQPGGRIVAIMSAAVTFRDTPLYRTVRAAVGSSGGYIEALPKGSFKESGTGVNAMLVVYNG